MKILVTGGAGFIGSHTCVDLLNNGYDVVVFDNFCNSTPEALQGVRQITGKDFPFYEGDLLNPDDLDKVFREQSIDAVIHFAALKAVGESVSQPLRYYENNISGTINLLKTMEKYGCRRIVFSSSATVYGMDNPSPCVEGMPTSATNPYGWTKVMMEQVLTDWAATDAKSKVILLRYFNPVGAHSSALIGENPLGRPNNIMPTICQTASGQLPMLKVFGSDYPTPDGTCVRDYIHVCDLADGHVKAMNHIDQIQGVEIYNLGTGHGVSVLEIIHAFEKVNGVTVRHELSDRRPGDIAVVYADSSKAQRELHWKATHTLEDMCRDSWNFVQAHAAKASSVQK
jgi:UDP-glucose 4-epimerase